MNPLEDKLLRMKRTVTEKQTAVTKLEGNLEILLEKIKKLTGCKTLEEAEAERDKQYELLSTREEELEKEVKQLESEFNAIASN